MVLSTDDKAYQKLLKSGSVLKGLRKRMGGGLGCIAGGLVLIGSGLFLLLMCWWIDMLRGGLVFFGFFGILGLPFFLIGIVIHARRVSGYLSYYQKNSGFSESELRQVEEELASSTAYVIAHRRPGGGKRDRFVSCIITDHYFVSDFYVRRISDLVAAAFTDSVPAWWVNLLTRNNNAVAFGIIFLAKTDDDAYFISFNTPSENKEELCTDIVDELHRRNPEMLRTARLLCDSKEYDLMKDCKEVLRLYKEGHTVEEKLATILIGGKVYKAPK